MKSHRFALLLLLMFALAIPNGMAEPTTQKEALAVIKNQLATISDRLKAIEHVKSNLDSNVTAQLLTLIRNPDEPIVLRAHLIEALVSSQDIWIDIELNKILNDPTL